IQHGDTSLAEVVEAVTTLELDVHELLVVKQHVEDFGLHQRNEFTQGATEVTVDELSKCFLVGLNDVVSLGFGVSLGSVAGHGVFVTIKERAGVLQGGGSNPVTSLDKLDDVGLVKRLGVSGAVFSGVLSGEVRGSPVVLVVERRTDVRGRIDSDYQLVVRDALGVKGLTIAATGDRGTAYAVDTVCVRLVLDRSESRQTSGTEQGADTERAINLAFVGFDVDVEVGVGTSPMGTGLVRGVRSCSHVIFPLLC